MFWRIFFDSGATLYNIIGSSIFNRKNVSHTRTSAKRVLEGNLIKLTNKNVLLITVTILFFANMLCWRPVLARWVVYLAKGRPLVPMAMSHTVVSQNLLNPLVFRGDTHTKWPKNSPSVQKFENFEYLHYFSLTGKK